jgi:hypothetical protein
MVSPTCFDITLPSSGSIPSAFWEMLEWGAVVRILWMDVLCIVKILIFKGLTVRRLYKSFGIKGLMDTTKYRNVCNLVERKPCKAHYVCQATLRKLIYTYVPCYFTSGLEFGITPCAAHDFHLAFPSCSSPTSFGKVRSGGWMFGWTSDRSP